MLNYWLHSKGPCGRWWEQGAPVISSKHTVPGSSCPCLTLGAVPMVASWEKPCLLDGLAKGR